MRQQIFHGYSCYHLEFAFTMDLCTFTMDLVSAGKLHHHHHLEEEEKLREEFLGFSALEEMIMKSAAAAVSLDYYTHAKL